MAEIVAAMSNYLYRLGRFSFRRRGLVVAVWALLLAAFAVGAATLSGPASDSFSIPGTEAQRGFDLLDERFPQMSADGAFANVVFAAPAAQRLTDPANAAAVGEVVARLQAAPQVMSVADPFQAGAVSPDGTVGYARVSYRVQAMDLSERDRAALLAAAESGRAAGLTVELGGDALGAHPAQGITELAGVAVAALVLLITFGSLIAAGLPLLTAFVGIGIGVSGVTAATGFIELGTETPVLAMMLGLAVAIDYALFIVFRYRHELAAGRDRAEAAGRAAGTAGSTVVFAGLTVVIALAGLSVVGIPFLTQIGVAAAATVAIAVIIALTLLPALLGFVGRRITGGRLPGLRAREVGGRTLGGRWARLVTRRPVPVLLVAMLGLGLAAAPVLDLRLGLPDDSTAAPDTTQRKAYDLLSRGFGPGFNGPLLVVVDAAGSADPAAATQRVADTITGLDDVVAVAPANVNPAGDTAVLTVVPDAAPSSAQTERLVSAIRDRAGGLSGETGATVAVTGATAMDIDISAKLGDALLPYLVLIVGMALLLLMVVFRSVLIPLKATAGFLLSIAATFGALVAVFQWGWLNSLLGVEATGIIVSFLPIYLIGVVFGLAMDYQFFLVSRMREEYVHGAEPTAAVVTGFQHGARVVTAAAIIMISVFSGFIFASDSLIKSIGFAFAAAILFDAVVVRMTIVPATMALLGRAAWWLPRWLDRALPNVDVEGERLRHRLDASAPAARELQPLRS